MLPSARYRSDGQQLYFIDGLDASVSNTDGAGPVVIGGGGGVIRGRVIFRGAINLNGQVVMAKPFNKLTAHELRITRQTEMGSGRSNR